MVSMKSIHRLQNILSHGLGKGTTISSGDVDLLLRLLSEVEENRENAKWTNMKILPKMDGYYEVEYHEGSIAVRGIAMIFYQAGFKKYEWYLLGSDTPLEFPVEQYRMIQP